MILARGTIGLTQRRNESWRRGRETRIIGENRNYDGFWKSRTAKENSSNEFEGRVVRRTAEPLLSPRKIRSALEVAQAFTDTRAGIQ